MSPEAREALTRRSTARCGRAGSRRSARPGPRRSSRPMSPTCRARIAAAGGDMAQGGARSGLVDKIGDRDGVRPPGRRDRRQRATTSVPEASERIDYRPLGRGQSGQRRRRRDRDRSPSPATSSTARPVSAPPAPRRSSRRSRRGSARQPQGAGGAGRFAAAARRSPPSGSARRCSTPRRKGLPVVVSMGSVAASGGYWVATAGDTIFAEP